MRLFHRFAPFAFLALFASSSTLQAQSAKAVAASARLGSSGIDTSQTVRLEHHVPIYADMTRLPSTPVAASEQFTRLTLVLTRAPQVEAAFQQLLQEQINPSSPRYHQWISSEQAGELYGPAQSDVDAVTSWLRSSGFTVLSVSPNRLFIDFSGSVAAVTKTFGTDVRTFSLANGEKRYSITKEPTVPAAVAPLVNTIFGLSQTIHHPASHRGALLPANKLPGAASSTATNSAVPDLYAQGGANYIVAGDFNTIYDVKAAANAGYTGTGQNIAIIGESRVYSNDITLLQGIEGLTSKLPTVIVPPGGADPGAAEGPPTTTVDNGLQDEATLDVNRTNGTAPGASLDLVISGDIGSQTLAQQGLSIAISYEVNTLKDPIMTISFGGCEVLNGLAATNYFDALFQTGAAAGISTFVSSGDSGAAGCNAFDNGTIPATQQLSVNEICVSQWVTCVGGTQFNDTASPTTYWGTTNSASNGYTTALGYIPEGAWNEPDLYQGTYADYGATGGGVSIYMSKPAYQTGTGVPTGTYRWVPDVAFSSSNHDGYVTCLTYLGATCGSFYGFGGTSAAAPSMAGIQAITNQKLGGRQGAMNTAIYKLANSSSYATAFHDATITTSGVSGCTTATPSICNNSTPAQTTLTGGQAGYALTTGYDPATGWGSLDVNVYLTALAATSTTLLTPTVTVALNPTSIVVGNTDSFSVTVTGTGATPTGTVQFQSAGVNMGAAQTLVAGKASITSTAYTTANTYAITAIYTPDTASSPVYASATSSPQTLTVTALPVPTIVLGLTPSTINVGSTTSLSVTLTGSSTVPTGTVQFKSGTSLLGSPATLVAGKATVTSPAFTAAGTFAITAVYTPDTASSTVYASVTSSAQNLTVNTLTTTTAVTTVNPSTIYTGATTSLTATVTPASGSIVATGTVAFYANGGTTAIATGTLSGGTVTATSSAFTTAGTYAISATYTPDTAGALVYTGSSSTVSKSLLVAAPFTLTANPSTATVTAGSTVIGTSPSIAVASTSGFTGTVTLNCSVASFSGANASYLPQCVFGSTSVAVGSATPLSFTTTARQSVMGGKQTIASLGGWTSVSLASLFMLTLPLVRRRRNWRSLMMAMFALAAVAAVTGCGSGGNAPKPSVGTTAGTYVVTVTGATTSPAYSTTTTVTLTVN